MLRVKIPSTFVAERRYAIETTFNHFLGVDIDLQVDETASLTSISGPNGGEVHVEDAFFSIDQSSWLKSTSLPQVPLQYWQMENDVLRKKFQEVPVLYGTPGLSETDAVTTINADLFGGIFFLLSRYEEVTLDKKDEHERFPATAAVAFRADILDRPLVDEYVEILWHILQRRWPNLERKKWEFVVHVTHDVDNPFRYLFTTPVRFLRTCGGDLIKRGQPMTVAKRIVNLMRTKSGNLQADPFNTFDLIMDISERHSLCSKFYFMTDHVCSLDSTHYPIDHPAIRTLLKKIHDRGHEIGLHGSYTSYLDPERTAMEFNRLVDTCRAEGIEQKEWGCRQHYLRFRMPTTLQNHVKAGINYDTTLGFADRPGFRCGTSREFPVFDIEQKRQVNIIERPLIVMEVSLLGASYMNLPPDSDEALQAVLPLIEQCKKYGGAFTLLWHNDHYVDPKEVALYERILAAV